MAGVTGLATAQMADLSAPVGEKTRPFLCYTHTVGHNTIHACLPLLHQLVLTILVVGRSPWIDQR